MDARSPVLLILANEDSRPLGESLATSLGYDSANTVIGTPLDAAQLLSQRNLTAKYILIDIAERTYDVLPEIDALAEHCDVDTRVAVMGKTNDIAFYRALKERGVSEYFAQQPSLTELRDCMVLRATNVGANGEVIAFIGASAGDGCSTLAINTAYALATEHRKPTVLVDFDYQFGMVAKQLDLTPKYGIKEIFDHPERGIDEILVNRMIVQYRQTLDVIAAPQTLHYLPQVTPEAVRDLISALQQKYAYVVLDLPHLWSNWTSSALSSAHHIVLISQLWLKSINHSARLLTAWQRMGISQKHVLMVINRSGSKFKEGINARDFERVSGRRIDLYIPNDIKTIVRAENQANTLLEQGNSLVANEIRRLADMIVHHDATPDIKASSGTR
ncbi:MAG: AAA family ATPase [Rickettsiales bacterium]|nr:AAA family ATPase [Rickettsiales bacterium]